MNILKKLAIPMLVALAYGPAQGLAAPILGSALKSFAILGATGVTSAGTVTANGNVGSAPTASITGEYSITGGTQQADTALAQQAQLDLDAAILAVNAGAANFTIAAGNGNLDAYQTAHGGVLAAGTYDIGAGTSNLLNTLVLDGGGSNTAVWRFRFSSTFIMSEGSDVLLQNVGDGSGVGIYWSVGSAATLDGDTLVGNVFANTLISSNGGLTLGCGRLASATSQVTLVTDTVSIGCLDNVAATNYEGSGGFDQGGDSGPSAVPEPGMALLLGFGLAGLFASRKKLLAVV